MNNSCSGADLAFHGGSGLNLTKKDTVKGNF